MKWKVGNTEIKNRVVLAPMAGISNQAFMSIVDEMGCGMAITELISAEGIVRKNQKTFNMLKGIDNMKMAVGIQLFGSDAKTIAQAAKIITDLYKIEFIDINMGCPVPKVALKSHAGSGLLRNPKKVEEIVSDTVKAVNIPVTVKIRSGWDSESINAVEIAKICEKAGARAITVHPRTRSQGYSGKANWNIIKQVKEAVNIPVIGNGDIKTIYDAKDMLEETNCDAIMIGRGCLGNPWLIKETVEYIEKNNIIKKPSYVERVKMIIKHFNLLLKYNNEKLSILEMRTNAAYYLKGMPKSIDIKKEIFKITDKERFINVLEEYINILKQEI